MNDIILFLRQVEILSLLSDDDIRAILPSIRPVEMGEGGVLFHEGDPGSELYIVESGTVITSIRLADGDMREVARFSRGDFFGEMSIFENAPRSATCATVSAARLLTIKQEDFFRLSERFPDIAVNMMYKMLNITTQRLRNTSGFLSDMVRWGEEARRRAIMDDLTGAYNRRYLDEALPKHFQAARDSHSPLSLIMMDLDYFRQVNERYGLDAGNRLLLAAVGEFKKQLRRDDVLVRYGGDEFTLLLPGADSRTAEGIGEAIRRAVAAMELVLDNGAHIGVTASQGIACYPEHAGSVDELKNMADRALYRAKEQGRNRIACGG